MQYIHTYTHNCREEVDKLKRAYEAMQRDMEAAASQGDAAVKFALSHMSCGNIDDFHAGLSGRIDDPFLDFEKAMEAEHCNREDSKAAFTTKNYSIQTCSHDEWQFVVQEGSTGGVPHTADMRHGRRIPNINEVQLRAAAMAQGSLQRHGQQRLDLQYNYTRSSVCCAEACFSCQAA
jgi:hypothetical protein